MMDITNELLQEKKFIAFLCDSAFMRKRVFRPGNTQTRLQATEDGKTLFLKNGI